MLSFQGYSATYTNNGSGLFSSGATWIGGVAPSASGDSFVITNGTVLYSQTNQQVFWGASQIQKGGILLATNSPLGSVFMGMGGNLVFSGNGQFNMTNINFYGQEYQGFVYQPVGTAQMIFTGQTNSITWSGVANRQCSTFLMTNGNSGATSITVSNLPASCQSNDVVVLVNGSLSSQNSYYYVVSSVVGNVVSFKTLAQLGQETNWWPRASFSASLGAAFPSNSVVVFASCPIAVIETNYLGQSVSTGGISNNVTGVMISVQYGFFSQSSAFNLYNCNIAGCNYGGAVGNYCSAFNLYNCNIAGCNNGGAAYNSCSAFNLYNCSNDNNSMAIQCFYVLVNSTITGSYADTFPAPGGWPFGPFQYDNKRYEFNTGLCALTNGIYWHSIVGTTNPIYATVTCSINSGVSRTVRIGFLLTNNIAYSATFGTNYIAPVPSSANVWTNYVITVSNTNAYPIPATLIVNAVSTNGAANIGMSTIQFEKESPVTKL